MREGAKQRLLGATAIVALAVIFVPMLFEDRHGEVPSPQRAAPEAPTFDPQVKSEIFLGPGDSGVGGLNPSLHTESEPLALPPEGTRESAVPPADTPGLGAAAPPPEPADEVSESQPAPSATVKPQGASTKKPPEPAASRGSKDGMPTWVVQVASTVTPEGAAQLESKLRAGGFTAFVEKAEVGGKTYYRVRVGPEANRARADQTAARLRSRFKLDTLVQSYP